MEALKVNEDAIRQRTQQLAETTRSQIQKALRDDTPMDDLYALVVVALRAVAELQLQMSDQKTRLCIDLVVFAESIEDRHPVHGYAMGRRVRFLNFCKRNGITSLLSLCNSSRRWLLKQKGMGRSVMRETEAALARCGKKLLP
jgi:DNA-directed RNA polymerase alpha subunit